MTPFHLAKLEFVAAPQWASRSIDRSVVYVTGIMHTAPRAVDGVICLGTPEIDGQAMKSLEEDTKIPWIGIGCARTVVFDFRR